MPSRNSQRRVRDLVLEEITLLASAARTATTDSPTQINRSARGVLVTTDVTAISATPSVTVAVQAQDATSGKWESLLFSAAITSVSTVSLLIHPEVAAAAHDMTRVRGFALPRTWRVKMIHADADSATYSVNASYVP